MGRPRASRLFPLFRSDAQARVLAAILFSSESRHVSAIAEAAQLPVSTVHREVERLEQAGLLTTIKVGSMRLVRPRPDSPYIEDVRSIVFKTYGPPRVLADELGAIDGIEEAHLFGSWAARARGAPGPPAQDIDVLVVGSWADHDLVDEVYGAARRAEDALRLDVNPVVVTSDEWEAGVDEFLEHVKDGPTLRIL